MTVSLINSYPQVYAVGHRAIQTLFMGPVLVEEKIDGSQFSFGIFGGEPQCRSKSVAVDAFHPEGMFKLAVETVQALGGVLHDGWVYRAEFLSKPKHNALAYARIPAHYLILFDVMTGPETYLTRAEKEVEAQRIGLECVPVIAFGEITDAKVLFAYLERESILGGVKIEGVVVKNYDQFAPDKKIAIGKYVSEYFKEVARKDWKLRNPTGVDFLATIGQALATHARWQKAVQHLREAGQLDHSPKDIGLLIREVPADILKEEEAALKDALFAHFWPQMRKFTTQGLPEWYKEQLVTSAFVQPNA